MTELKELVTLQGFENILQESNHRKVLIFKHSTSCPISAHAWQEVQNFIRQSSDEVQVALVKVIESRPVSNQIALDLKIKHESPQILLLSKKNVVWHSSHMTITQAAIEQALKSGN
jgi:bacillithiol system protein YtxJ